MVDTGACPIVTPKSDGSCAAVEVQCFETLKPNGLNKIFSSILFSFESGNDLQV